MFIRNDLVTLVAGAATVTVGLKNKVFYSKSGGVYSKKPVSRRVGMTLFLFVGGMLLVFGLAHLIIDLQQP
jgi:hypothetical protein